LTIDTLQEHTITSHMPSRKPKVLVAMSGGVDSSVAAALLLREGYEVVGCFMRLGSPGETFDELEPIQAVTKRSEVADQGNQRRDACATDHTECGGSGKNHMECGGTGKNHTECGGTKSIRIGHQGCCSINDAADARLVAAKLGIPFYVCNFKKDFGRIIDYFVDEYNAGRTPNPCVRCNDWLKFGKLHDYAKQIDAEFVASGHYARILPSPSGTPGLGAGGEGSYRLLRGIDHSKDQSYVLFGAPRERLKEMLLPIGGLRKSHVRRLAREFDLPVFDKPDSQEICFVPDNDYAGLVKRRSPQRVRAGRIVDTSGKIIGEHDGHQHFTIGQRRGTGVAMGYPIYVVHKDAESNTVTVGGRDELMSSVCYATEANWLMSPPPPGRGVRGEGEGWIPCTAKIRYNAEPVPARVRALESDSIEVSFNTPQFAIAPGQAVVCYDGDQVMCGGWIRDAM